MDQAEKLRNVVKLRNQVNKPDARVITVTSGKGGVGKSNVAVNLAVQIQKMGKRVIVFDADFGLANVEVMFGSIPKYTLGDVIFHGKKMHEIISEGPLGIGFVSGGTGISGLNDLSTDQIMCMINSLGELDQLADVIIIDTGAGISNHVMEFVVSSAEVLLVTTPDPSSLTDSYSLLKALHNHPKFNAGQTKVSVLTNRVMSADEGRHVYEKLKSVVAQFLQEEIFYAGMIPQDGSLEKAVRQQKPVSIYAPSSKSARAFETVASGIMNNERKQGRVSLGISQLFSNFWKQNN